MKKYVCTICGFIYDEAVGIPSAGIAAGTLWEALPDDWVCPLCGAAKGDFKVVEEGTKETATENNIEDYDNDVRPLNNGELAALCSNLAKGCNKQCMDEEEKLYLELAGYFQKKREKVENSSLAALINLINDDLEKNYPKANEVANLIKDRGTLRALTWNEKVTRILNSILNRYNEEGDKLLNNTNIYVCQACGFVYIGEEALTNCPVCKVPSWKFDKIEEVI